MSIERDLEGWTIAFDLDGTLVDSAPDLIGTLNRMLAQYDLPPVPMSSARHLVGHGAMALLRHGFMEAGAAWDEAHAPGLFERFIEDYLAHIHEAAQKAGGDPARCVMVGDSTTDTRAAKDAGVPCIVVGFGYNDVPREELGGDVVIDHYDGFEAGLAEVMGAGS